MNSNLLSNSRKIDIDLLKCILMYLVILGHLIKISEIDELNGLYRVIYWFHMPAFFLITGYLTNFSKDGLKHFCKRKIHNYVIPYFSYCFVIVFIFRLNPFEYFIRIFWGGAFHYGITGPLWYINCLFVTLLFSKFLIDKLGIKGLFVIAVIMWLFAHFFREYLSIPIPDFARKYFKSTEELPFPWGINEMFLSVLFVVLGNFASNYSKLKNYGYLFLISALVFVVYDFSTNYNYMFDMKYLICDNWLFDFILPISFTLGLYWICVLATRYINNVFGNLIVVLSKAGLVCFFIHMVFIFLILEVIDVNCYSVFFFSAIIYIVCVLLYILFGKVKILSFLLLGK